MIRSGSLLLPLLLALALPGWTRPAEFDPFQPQREMIRRGVQAVLMCNGLFTSGRSPEQVFAQELAYLDPPLGSAAGGPWRVHRDLRAVEVGVGLGGAVVRAAFREGIGCVVMAPEQSLAEIDRLPSLPPVPEAGAYADRPWPLGDRVESASLAEGVDPEALQAASDRAFDRDTPEQDTLSLLVVHRGRIVHERYADGVDRHTRTRTWSTAKSIAVTLIGMLVDQGRLELDAPLPVEWLPEGAPAPETDPRREITLRHVLHMSSGLYPVDSGGSEYATGSGLAYWAGTSSAAGARDRGLIREPGTSWDYENYDTLLSVRAMKNVLGNDYLQFPRRALLEPLGMHRTLLGTDRFGDFILSSQVYASARDLARFGMLWVQGGVWQGQRLISEEWVEFVRTPAPASAARGHDYGGQFWLVPDDRGDVPADAFATAGNRGQYVIMIPSRQLVIVRRGLDYGDQGFDRWDLAREVLAAFE